MLDNYKHSICPECGEFKHDTCWLKYYCESCDECIDKEAEESEINN